MNRSVSSFLDVARFIAALTVVLAHIDESWAPHTAPFFTHLGVEAVGCFFVISGFVIAYVSHTRETDLAAYAINRSSRIYSVVVPCLILTLIFDVLGKHFFPAIYASNWPPTMSNLRELGKILFSISFLNQCWGLDIYPGSNVPFWSICFEVFYYIIFACAFYLQGLRRLALLTILLFCAGPKIVEELPLWLIGVALFRGSHHRQHTCFGAMLIAFSAIAWILIEALRWKFQISEQVTVGWAGVWQRYEAGIAFAGLLAGVIALGGNWTIPRPLMALSNSTFSLYLLHYPLGHLMAAIAPPDLSAPMRYVLFIAVLVFAGLLLTLVTDSFRVWMRERLRSRKRLQATYELNG